MKWREWLDNWSMNSLKLTVPFMEMEWAPKDEDRDAAWELYVELLTRITTQALPADHGDEGAALSSVHSLFEVTRLTLKNHSRECIEFAKIAVVVLNQVIRPFTTKWHDLSKARAFDDPARRMQFRSELAVLQKKLLAYSGMLAEMAGIEDLSSLEPGQF